MAPLGLAFAQRRLLPARFRNGAFVGEHGSWNRTPLSGYKVVFVPFARRAAVGKPVDVLTGFLGADGEAQGRPVGVAIDRSGALLVADDAAIAGADAGTRFPRQSPRQCVGALVVCLYMPTLMTASLQSGEALALHAQEFHVATEGAWDVGGAAGLLLSAALGGMGRASVGCPPPAAFGAAVLFVELRRYYAQHPRLEEIALPDPLAQNAIVTLGESAGSRSDAAA